MPNHRYIPTLDGWRAIAILLVVFRHDETHRIGWFSTSWLTAHGGTGVAVFFAISGLLICTLLLDEEQQTGKISLTRFYLRRAFRILPAAFVYLAGVTLLSAFGLIAVRRIDLFGALLFFRNYLANTQATWYTVHFWSLSVEEHFYFLLPGFLILCTRFRSRILLLAGTTTLVAFALAMRSHFREEWIYLNWSDFNLGALLIAAGAAVALHRDSIRKLVARALHPLPAILVTAAVITTGKLATTLLPFLMVAMVSSTMLNPENWISAVLESRALRFIGRRSYSLYLWQELFMTAHYRPGIIDFRLQKWPLSIISAFVCACLSYSLVEQPMISLGKRVVHYYNDRRKARKLVLVED